MGVVDWRNEDPRHPSRLPGEKDSIYKDRCKEAVKFTKNEAKRRHAKIQSELLDPLGLHFEPTLRPKNPSKILPYLANEVAHTRIIDTVQEPRSYPEKSSRRAYKQARNHDGYRLPYQLYRAERFNLKACWLVHAHCPSMVIKDQLAINYLISEQLKIEGLDPQRRQNLLNYLANNHTTGFFNKKTFMHYRYWFFDIDHVCNFEVVKQKLAALGLLQFLAVAVETSAGKYHLYFKSELIANTHQVKNWVESNKGDRVGLPYDQEHVTKLADQSPGHPDWVSIAKRGVLDAHNIHRSNIPLPGGVSAAGYTGDDTTHDEYRYLWGRLNEVLGGDLGVLDGTRVAQLPFYRNPKNGFMAGVIYSKQDIPVMKLADVAKALPCGLVNVVLTTPETPTPTRKKITNVVEETLNVQLTEVADTTKKEKEIAFTNTDRLVLPKTPEEYARQNHLTEKITWELDITGRSNAMLLLLAKYAWRYVDLYNDHEIEAFWAAVVEPYFRLRISKDLVTDLGLRAFKKRFLVCCLTNRRWDLVKKPPAIGAADLTKIFKLEINQRSPGFFDDMSYTNEHHYEIILDYIADTLVRGYVKGVTTKDDKTLLYKFFLPITYLRDKIPGYNKKLTALAKIGFFTREKSFVQGKTCKTCRVHLDNGLVKDYLEKLEPKAGKPKEEPKEEEPKAEAQDEWAVMRAKLLGLAEPIVEPDFGPPPDILSAPVKEPEIVLTSAEREAAVEEKRNELWELSLDPLDYASSSELRYLDDEITHRTTRRKAIEKELAAEIVKVNLTSTQRISTPVLKKFVFEACSKVGKANVTLTYLLSHYDPIGQAMWLCWELTKLEAELNKEFIYLREIARAKARIAMPKDGMTPEAKNDRKFKVMNEMAKLVFNKTYA